MRSRPRSVSRPWNHGSVFAIKKNSLPALQFQFFHEGVGISQIRPIAFPPTPSVQASQPACPPTLPPTRLDPLFEFLGAGGARAVGASVAITAQRSTTFFSRFQPRPFHSRRPWRVSDPMTRPLARLQRPLTRPLARIPWTNGRTTSNNRDTLNKKPHGLRLLTDASKKSPTFENVGQVGDRRWRPSASAVGDRRPLATVGRSRTFRRQLHSWRPAKCAGLARRMERPRRLTSMRRGRASKRARFTTRS